MELPSDLKYTKEHEWVKAAGQVATMGITEYAQKELGDIVFVEPVAAGTQVEQLKEMTTIESVKAASDLFAPVSGKVVEFNQALEDAPELVNKDPYGAGWIVKIELKNPAEIDNLLAAGDYQKLIEEA